MHEDKEKLEEEPLEKMKMAKNRLTVKETSRAARAAKWSIREVKDDIPIANLEKESDELLAEKSENKSSEDDLSDGEALRMPQEWRGHISTHINN